ncbi:MAG: hypothetical protein KatS3mg077_1866 [Candidatus Binatia bacterium]|nr:MAG: hypothetical protein KatS3mg077_1866 [Candidatus Binatia bacterium]
MQQRLGHWFLLSWLGFFACVQSTPAAVVGPPDYVVGKISFPGPVQGDVALIGTSVFAGQGTFGAGTQTVVRRDWNGNLTTVLTGLNSIGGLAGNHAYLFVTDNGGELTGATTGDTVFALPAPVTAAASSSALGLEIDAPGSVPYAQGIAIGADGQPYIGDAAGSGSGRVLRHRAFGYPPLATLFGGYDFVAGLAFGADQRLYFGNLDSATFVGAIYALDFVTNTQSLIASGLSGAYDHAFDHDGRLLVTGGFDSTFTTSTVVAVDVSNGNVAQFASGFSFSSGIDVDRISGRVFVVDFGSSDVTTFTPIDLLVSGGGTPSSDCWSEFSDVTPVLNKQGKPTTKSVCRDGESCDRDGSANGVCTFALGLCLRVPRAGCSVPTLQTIELVQRGQSTLDPSLQSLLASAQTALPGSTPECVGPVPVQVPLVSTSKGVRPGKKSLRVRVRDASQRADVDRLTLRCLP